jgi:hypothetical protein
MQNLSKKDKISLVNLSHHIRHLEYFWIDLANKMPQLIVVDVLAMKNKKGKNFVLEKE